MSEDKERYKNIVIDEEALGFDKTFVSAAKDLVDKIYNNAITEFLRRCEERLKAQTTNDNSRVGLGYLELSQIAKEMKGE